MELEVTVEDTGTPDQEAELVAVEDATDEDLKAFLAEGDELADKLTQPKTEQKAEPEKKPDSNPELKKPAELPKQPPTAAEWAKFKADAERARLWDERRSTEIGRLRKELVEARADIAKGLSEKWVDSPQEAHANQRQIEKIDENLAAIDEEEEGIKRESLGRQILAKQLQPDEQDIAAVAEMLADDGLNPEFIKEFSRNPFKAALPETLVHVYKRAHREKTLKMLYPVTEKLLARVKDLEKQLSEKGAKTAERIQKNLNAVPQMNGSQPTAAATIEDLSATDFTQMDDAQLKEFLRKNGKK